MRNYDEWKLATPPEYESDAERHMDLDDGINEPFCSCGRRWSQCDGSRKGCNKYNTAHVASINNATGGTR